MKKCLCTSLCFSSGSLLNCTFLALVHGSKGLDITSVRHYNIIDAQSALAGNACSFSHLAFICWLVKKVLGIRLTLCLVYQSPFDLKMNFCFNANAYHLLAAWTVLSSDLYSGLTYIYQCLYCLMLLARHFKKLYGNIWKG